MSGWNALLQLRLESGKECVRVEFELRPCRDRLATVLFFSIIVPAALVFLDRR